MLIAALLALQPAPPASVPCPDGAVALADGQCPRLIFFDSGKAEIRREWEAVLDEAAGTARTGRRLIVTGNSDREGGAAVNRRMARLRAETVATALRSRGVAAADIVVRAEGEDQPLIATPDGVREIQNRRVSITFAP